MMALDGLDVAEGPRECCVEKISGGNFGGSLYMETGCRQLA